MEQKLISLLGLFVMMGLAWLMSSNRSKVSLRVVFGGLLLQFLFAFLILNTVPGREFFQFLGDQVDHPVFPFQSTAGDQGDRLVGN